MPTFVHPTLSPLSDSPSISSCKGPPIPLSVTENPSTCECKRIQRDKPMVVKVKQDDDIKYADKLHNDIINLIEARQAKILANLQRIKGSSSASLSSSSVLPSSVSPSSVFASSLSSSTNPSPLKLACSLPVPSSPTVSTPKNIKNIKNNGDSPIPPQSPSSSSSPSPSPTTPTREGRKSRSRSNSSSKSKPPKFPSLIQRKNPSPITFPFPSSPSIPTSSLSSLSSDTLPSSPIALSSVSSPLNKATHPRSSWEPSKLASLSPRKALSNTAVLDNDNIRVYSPTVVPTPRRKPITPADLAVVIIQPEAPVDLQTFSIAVEVQRLSVQMDELEALGGTASLLKCGRLCGMCFVTADNIKGRLKLLYERHLQRLTIPKDQMDAIEKLDIARPRSRARMAKERDARFRSGSMPALPLFSSLPQISISSSSSSSSNNLLSASSSSLLPPAPPSPPVLQYPSTPPSRLPPLSLSSSTSPSSSPLLTSPRSLPRSRLALTSSLPQISFSPKYASASHSPSLLLP